MMCRKKLFFKVFFSCAVEKCKSTQKQKLVVIKVEEKNARSFFKGVTLDFF